jgi:hypothetical protein
MPSPKSKTRRASKSKSPNSGTRRAAAAPAAGNFAGMRDPLFEAMERGNLKWGDILMNAPMAASGSPRRRAASSRSSRASSVNSVFENFSTPDLRLKKFIWEHFPVVLEEIPARGGVEKYAVKWHRKNLEEWRSSRTTSWDEAMEYQLFSQLRLLHSLRKHPHLYKLHEPRTKDEIVVIEVIGGAPAPVKRARSPPRAAAGAAAAAAAAAPRVPALKKLNDITTFFPGIVVWKKVDGRKGESTYALSIRADFQRRTDAKTMRLALGDLEAALRASRFWGVLAPADKSEFLRLEMRHD